jgi:hypothetical protein
VRRAAIVALSLVGLPALATLVLLPRLTSLRRPRRSVAIERLPAPTEAVRVLADASETRDGGRLGDRRFLATSGGLVLDGAEGGDPLTLDRGLGAASHDLLAACSWNDRIVGAAGDGSLLVWSRGHSSAFRVAAPLHDVGALGPALLLATDLGLFRWTGGDEAREVSELGEVGVATLAVGPTGAAAATARGDVWLVDDDGARLLVPADEDRVVAMTWDGDALWLGRGERLDRVATTGGVVRVRADGGVTALAAAAGQIFVARPEGGVLLFRPGAGGERSTLAGVRIHRLRVLADGVVAFGRGGAWRIDANGIAERWGEAPALELASGRVAALLVERDALWVGTERGLDVVEGDTIRHLPLPPVLAIVATPDTGEVLAVTTAGRLRVDREWRVRRDLGPAPLVEATPRVVTPAGLVTARDEGLALTDPLTGTTRRLRPPVPTGRVTALGIAGDLLWVGTDDGLLGFPLLPLLAAPPQS